MQNWLYYSGSFIEKLKEHGIQDSRIDVVHQDWQLAEADEYQELQLNDDIHMLVREVLIASENHTWMFARTVFPPQTLTGEQQELANLKTRSLGSVLFKDPTLQRSEFQLTSLQPDTKLFKRIHGLISLPVKSVWSRRSMFFIQKKPLLLTEVFLPDFEKWAADHGDN